MGTDDGRQEGTAPARQGAWATSASAASATSM
jgi:hypothetical protein